jgi:ABC-2 type transport system permease protein
MNSTFVIARKEIKSFFLTPSFYFIAGVITLILSLLFPAHFSMFVTASQGPAQQMGGMGQQANIHYGLYLRHLSYMNLLLILVVPALTMKLFAEEKKLKTFDLLLTSPVTSWEIVIGKFIAVAVAIAALMVIALLYPLVTLMFVDKIHWPSLILAFSGIYVLSLIYVAMNLFCSSLTESVLIAFILSIILNVSIWFVGIGVELVDSQWARQVFEHISLANQLSGLVEGALRIQTFAFFFSAVALFLFLAERVVESHRWRAS